MNVGLPFVWLQFSRPNFARLRFFVARLPDKLTLCPGFPLCALVLSRTPSMRQ
jgi:hypothetical protein